MLSLLFALLAGVVTIAAPCTLPILPILLGASLGRATTVRPALIALGFVTSFTALALLIDAITRSLNFDPNVLRDAAIVMLIVFGLLMISPTPFERMSAYVRGFFVSRHKLALEALALRQQLAVFKRKQTRPKLRRLDRLFWIALRNLGPGWTEALIIVKPETVVSWHRAASRLFLSRLYPDICIG